MMKMIGPDGDPWGIPAADRDTLIEALAQVPDEAELWKVYVTGNLGVVFDDELIAIIDLQTGTYNEAGG